MSAVCSIFSQILQRCQAQAGARQSKFRFKNKLVSLDASVIDLCLELYDWAQFRRTKGAVKLHLLLDHCCPNSPRIRVRNRKNTA